MIIAIIGHRLGTPTGVSASGTLEEIEIFLKKRKPGEIRFDAHVFFNRSGVDPYTLDKDQLEAVQNYRKNLNQSGVNYGEFRTLEDLSEMAQFGISNFIARSDQIAVAEEIGSKLFDEFDELGSDDAMELAAEDMSSVKDALESLSVSMQKTTNELTGLNDGAEQRANGESSSAFFDEISKLMSESAEELRPSINIIRDNLSSSYTYLNYAVTIMIEDAGALSNDDFQEGMSPLREAMEPALEEFLEFVSAFTITRDSIQNIPRRRSNLNRAKRTLVREYDRLIEGVKLAQENFSALLSTKLGG